MYQNLTMEPVGRVMITETKDWISVTGDYLSGLEVAPVYFVFQGTGSMELLEFSFLLISENLCNK